MGPSGGGARTGRLTWREHAHFLGAFMRDPFKTGSVAPSSRWLAARMVEGLGLATARTVVELGPGTGAITRAIVPELGPDTIFLAVEFNPAFAAALGRDLPRVTVLNDTAARLPELLAAQGRESADCILSSLPFAAFPEQLQGRLLDAAVRSLAQGGLFVNYAYIPAAWLPAGRRFRRLLESRFRRVGVTPVVWRNIPPAFVYRCEK